MKELQRKQKIKRMLYSLPALAILAIFAILLTKGAVGVVGKQRESARHLRELRQEAQALSARSDMLKKDIDRLNTEEGIVKEIKEKFNVSEEGEHVAILVDQQASEKSAEALESAWYKEFWNSLSRLWH